MPYLKLTSLIQMHGSCGDLRHIQTLDLLLPFKSPCSKTPLTGVNKWTNVPSRSTSILFHVNQGPGLYCQSSYD